jgi:ABC-type glycerol-3-phosphate transport system substrate-binding protein
MYRQANFYSAFFPKGTEFGTGPGGRTFYCPADSGHPVLVGGISAGAFRDAPEVWKVMQYLGSPEFANTRQAAQSKRVGGGLSGFLTGNTKADTTKWAPLEQKFLEQLQTASPAAFDASTRCRPKSGRAPSGPTGRRSSTATRTPRQRQSASSVVAQLND